MSDKPFDPTPVLEPRDRYGFPIREGKTPVLRFLVTHEDGTQEEKRVALTDENYDVDLADALGLRDGQRHRIKLILPKPPNEQGDK